MKIIQLLPLLGVLALGACSEEKPHPQPKTVEQVFREMRVGDTWHNPNSSVVEICEANTRYTKYRFKRNTFSPSYYFVTVENNKISAIYLWEQ